MPGIKLSLSSHGLSASIVAPSLTLNSGSNGIADAISIRETNSSANFQHPTGPNRFILRTRSLHLVPAHADSVHSPVSRAIPLEHIHGSSTELLTSQPLRVLKRLLQTAFEQHEDISQDLDSARVELVNSLFKYEDWEAGVLYKRLFKKAFAKIGADCELARARVDELLEQLRLSRIDTHIEVDSQQDHLFHRMKDEFAALCDCDSIWDVQSHQATARVHERTTAVLMVKRARVRFNLSSCDFIHLDQRVPCLRNAKGGELYLYPGFILYRAAREILSVIDYHDVTSKASLVAFHEEERIPSDSRVIGYTCAKRNKDGSLDIRSHSNRQIPVVQYGLVTLKSPNGMWEEFYSSNPQRLFNFLDALVAFTSSFAAIATH